MRAVWAILLLLGLAGCAALPHDGPSARSFPKRGGKPAARYAVVDLDYAATQAIAAHPPAALAGLSGQSSAAPTDLIAEGDALSVMVIEAGAGGLFSRPMESAATGAVVGGDNQKTFPRMIVDPDGDLTIPFAGAVHVAGLRPRDAADAIRRALRGRAINPQVAVTVLDSRANSVSVLGEVRTAGHFILSAHNDHLLDVLASAGGPTKPPADLLVVVSRDGVSAEAPLDVLLNDPRQNVRLAPQDQIRILNRPRKFSTFGAFLRNSQTLIEDDKLTLADAISRSGGVDTNSGNAGSVMVFRFERPEVAHALGVANPPTVKGVPIVYRLNLRQPDGVFIADSFDIEPSDLLYVPRSDITEAQKFLQILDSVTQLTYNINATSTVAP
jgi:polysaccharide export outer membrane protein